ncbi:MAG TPA: spermidine/putrescine ABC transporter substrate-binding protein [Acidimicrobiia bacterium]|jgi:spermidine/putrescine transport system substrate-binding protein
MSHRDDRIRRDQIRLARIGMSRRQFLGRGGALLGGLAIGPAVLAACGGSSGSSSSGSDKSVSISNWTSYITDQSKSDFTKDTGIKLTYTEDINDNDEYFAKIRPNLSRDQSIGRDGFVLTDWMANRMINQVKWVQPFDPAAFTNKSNLRAPLKSPGFDPTRKFSAPWASGVTGIAYNIKTTGKEIKTIQDFLDAPGTKTALTEMRDTVGLFMRSMGIDTAHPTYAKAEPAFDALEKAVNDGKIKGFNGNEYVSDLGAGNLAAAFAWSGDVAQITLDNPDVRFAVPDSGGMLWSDNFMIPKTTDKAKLATDFINFFYDPKNAAVLTAGIKYISPVEGVDAELTKMGGKAAALVNNPLVVPTDEFLATLAIFGPLDSAEEVKFDKRFSQILGSG